jgi:TonB-dependent receptor
MTSAAAPTATHHGRTHVIPAARSGLLRPAALLRLAGLAVSWAALFPLPAAQAQTAGASAAPTASASGSITGRATDVTSHAALAGARVSVEGTTLETFTNQQGNYRLENVPAGPVTVTLSYVGYSNQVLHGEVLPGQALVLDGHFTEEILSLGAFSVTSQVLGTAKAVNLERAAPALTNVVASDAVGAFPDKNLAEALQRIPGVEAVRDKGEGRFINIRGLDQIYNGISMNGIRMSTAEKGTRMMELDVISSTFISSMEVNKVNLPDMDTDDMGGSVNIKTRSGFDQDSMLLTVSSGTNFAHQEDRHGGYNEAINFADQFDDGKIGFALDLAAEYRPFTDYTEPGTTWSQVKSPTDGQQHWILASQDFRHYDAQRWRQGFSTGFDFKLSPGEQAYIRILDSDYTESNQQWLTTFPFGSGTVTALSDTTATTTIKAAGIIKSLAEIKNNKRETSSIAGLDSTEGPWTNNFAFGYTTGKYTRPTLTLAYANTAATAVSYGFNGPYNNVVTQVSGPSLDDPASYSFSTKSGYSNTTSNMHEYTVKDGLRYDLPDASLHPFVKVGVQYRDKNNNLDTSAWKINSAPFGLSSAVIYPGNDVQDTMGSFPNFQIRQEAANQFYTNQSQFPTTLTVATTYGGAFRSAEDIGSMYLMGGLTFGQLKLTAGARIEHTHFWMSGWQYNSTTGAVTPDSGSRDYNNVLPAVIGEYEFTANTIGRFSWTNTLSRADYSATTPGRSIDDVNKVVSQGNIYLNPLQAVNWDASLEHYYSPFGLVSVAGFYKSIKNFTYQAQSGTDPATGYLLTTYFNGPTAWIYGVELNWVQQFKFLPGPLGGLGVVVNALLGNSRASYPTRPGESIPFTGFGHEFGSVALTYAYSGWNARLAETFHGRRLEANSTIGANYTQDQYEEPWESLDASISYSFLQHWQVYAQGSNLNNAALREYYGGTGSFHRIQTYEAYGWSAESGVRWTY